MLFWIILLALVTLISVILAYRSMRDYREIPATLTHHLYLIRLKGALDSQVMKKLYTFAQNLDSIISLEVLFKGREVAWVIYGPSALFTNFPQLNLLELEDYLADSLVDQSFAWVMSTKTSASLNLNSHFLEKIELGEEQKFFWQIVCFPETPQNNFQVTVRGMVIDKDASQRLGLAKHLIKQIEQTNLKQNRDETTSKIFADFKARSLIPREVSQFILTTDQILALLGSSN